MINNSQEQISKHEKKLKIYRQVTRIGTQYKHFDVVPQKSVPKFFYALLKFDN